VAWVRQPTFAPTKALPKPDSIKVSVIIPIRNEAQHILSLLEDLNRQSLDYQTFEVIVVNDHSSDASPQMVLQFIPQAKYVLQLLHLPAQVGGSPKKQAINLAIQQCRGELIVTTDGDCRVGKDWLSMFWQFYHQQSAQLMSSAVTFAHETTVFEQMQTVEFASLVAAGASTMIWGLPTMCNGANLAYTKAAFAAVGGFEGVEQVASGDDEFLMHKIAQKYPQSVYFLKHQAATVSTQAKSSFAEFYQQRKRWGSKWKYYKNLRMKALALFIFLVHLNILGAGAGLVTGFLDLRSFMFIVGIKWLPEWLYLGSFLSFLHKKKFIFWILPVQLVYPFYVVLFGLAAQGRHYEWKGRKMQ
jgi:cellulose synthase/poly-beta-1,6-N-acetylglucosamine synthase-like glycosyltransferase